MNAIVHYRDLDRVAGSAGDVLAIIRSGVATSRSAIARVTGLAPSTVSLRVDTLQQLGLITDVEVGPSKGGRKTRPLQVDAGAGFVAAFDIGGSHLHARLTDLAGNLLVEDADGSARTTDSPEAAVRLLWNILNDLVARSGRDLDGLADIVVGVPAPVVYPSGRVVLPSFMPTWHNASLPNLFAAYTDVPVLVENDANLAALAELAELDHPAGELLVIKLGTRIGCGIISGGRLHRGSAGAAGEISHVAVQGTSAVSCICGIPNCLESVASGGALAARLSANGYDVRTAADVVELAQTDLSVVEILREAGAQIGSVLAGIVNFFSPQDVVLGGTMSMAPALVAAIRGEIFQKCLPIITNDLDVRSAKNPTSAGIVGATYLGLEEALAPARIDERAQALSSTETA